MSQNKSFILEVDVSIDSHSDEIYSRMKKDDIREGRVVAVTNLTECVLRLSKWLQEVLERYGEAGQRKLRIPQTQPSGRLWRGVMQPGVLAVMRTVKTSHGVSG